MKSARTETGVATTGIARVPLYGPVRVATPDETTEMRSYIVGYLMSSELPEVREALQMAMLESGGAIGLHLDQLPQRWQAFIKG